MTDLEPVEETFIADTAPYTDALNPAIRAAEAFAAANLAAAEAVSRLNAAMGDMAGTAARASAAYAAYAAASAAASSGMREQAAATEEAAVAADHLAGEAAREAAMADAVGRSWAGAARDVAGAGAEMAAVEMAVAEGERIAAATVAALTLAREEAARGARDNAAATTAQLEADRAATTAAAAESVSLGELARRLAALDVSLAEAATAAAGLAERNDVLGRAMAAAGGRATEMGAEIHDAFTRAAAAQREYEAGTGALAAAQETAVAAARALASGEEFAARTMDNARRAAESLAVALGGTAAAESAAAVAAREAAAAVAEQAAVMKLAEDIAARNAATDLALAKGAQVLEQAWVAEQAIMAATTAGWTQGEKAAAGLGVATTEAGKAAGRAAGGFRLFGLSGNAWHWIFGVSAEILAVTIPALIAMGSAALVASQGVQMVTQHMQAVYTATEATGNQLHITAGQALGFSDALQKAQNAANAQVYEALGGVLDMVGGKFSSFAAGSDQALTKVHSGFTGLTQAGNQLLSAVDQLVAHMQYDLVTGTGAQVSTLLANMTTDAVRLGQVLGNLGHALLNWAADMPGIAEVLLSIADALSKVLVIATQPAWYNLHGALIALAMGAEEFYRWGGLLPTMLGKIGLATQISTEGMSKWQAVGAKFTSIFATIGGLVPRVVGGLVSLGGTGVTALGKLAGAGEEAGAGMSRLGGRITALASNTALMGWIGAAVVAAVGLAVALDHVRNSAQQLIDSTNKAAASAANLAVISTLASGMSRATAQIAQQEAILATYSPAVRGAGEAVAGWITSLQHVSGPLGGVAQGALNVATSHSRMTQSIIGGIPIIGGEIQILTKLVGGSAEAASKVQQLTAAQRTWAQQSVNVVQGAALISRQFGVSFVGALELADQAGVHLTKGLTGMSQAAVENRIRIADLVAGYQAMGQDNQAISGDMEVLAIQSGLAATKIQQLSQAMQAYDSQLVGGTSATAALAQSFANVGVTVGKAGKGLGDLGSAASINLPKVSQFAHALALGPVQSAQAWTNFNQIAGQTIPQLIGWFQTAGAEGILSGQKMHQGILDAISGLVPLAKDSKTAQAEVVGLARSAGMNVPSWAALVKEVKGAHASLGGLNAIVGPTTGKMAELAKVAQNLGNVMSTSIISTMDAAKLSVSGLSGEASKLANDLAKPSTPASTLNTDLTNIYKTVESLTGSKATAESVTQAYANSFGKAGQAVYAAWEKMRGSSHRGINDIHSSMSGAVGPLTSAGRRMADGAFLGFASANLPGRLHTQGERGGQGVRTGLDSQRGGILGAARSIASMIPVSFGALPGSLFGAGSAAMRGFLSGLQSMWGSITSFVGGIASWIAAHKGPIEKDRQLLVPHGMAIMDGLLTGLRSREGAVTAQAQRAAALIAAAFGGSHAAGMTPGGVIPGGSATSPAAMTPGGSMLVPFTVPAGVTPGGTAAGIRDVTVHVAGHVVTQQQLGDLIREIMQEYGHRNVGTGMVKAG